MKILQCHNLYQKPGGEDAVVEDERALLTEHGHTVVQHLRHNDEVNHIGRIRLAIDTVWNRSSVRTLEALIRQEKPDIVHFHNTMPLISPAAYYAANRCGVPVVQTLHNYRLLCPEGTFIRDQTLCEDCLDKRIKWPAVRHGCYRNSRSASAVLTVMSAAHHLKGTYQKHVDAYIALSSFGRNKMIAGGLPDDRIHIKPNFMAHDPGVGSGAGGYALYLGRLSYEKGIDIMLAAWDQLDVPIPLQIAGAGPLEDKVQALAKRHDHVRHLGWVGFPELNEILKQASYLVIPSVNYEGFPKVIAEAYACGLPIVTAGLGSLAESVADGVTGYHFKAGDAGDLARIIQRLHQNPDLLIPMRKHARAAYESRYTAHRNYEKLMNIYQLATEQAARKC